MIKAVIIDDEQLAIDTLQWQLKEFCPEVVVTSTFNNPETALDFLQNHTIDLCFLDINMPEMSGFDFLQHWNSNPPFTFIFTTAYSEHAIKAFKVSAFDYLLKPIDEEDLITTIQKFIKHKTPILNEQIQLLFQQLNNPKSDITKVAFPTQECIYMVEINSIIRLESDNNYTTVILENEPPILVSKTLKDVEKLLPQHRFMRIHQKHTVDLEKINQYKRGKGGSVLLSNDETIPVSRAKKDELITKLGI